MNRFVLDTSFAFSWVIESERTPEGLALFDRMANEKVQAVVPALWPEEMANVFLTVERAKKLSPDQVATWVEIFQHLPILIDPPSLPHSLGEVRLLAQKHGLSAYDARYLHLAIREKLPLATGDKKLIKVAPHAGVELVTPHSP